MNTLSIRNTRLANQDRIFEGDLLVRHGRIAKIAPGIAVSTVEEIDAGRRFRSRVGTTVVSGQVAWHAGQLRSACRSQALVFQA